MAIKLSDSGIKTKAYHAGLGSKLRNDIQQEWMNGVVSVIAATVSFGMGVDKSSVRFVVHWKIPQSVERYYQESGRAGRDGKKSYCRLYYSRYEKEQILFLLRKDRSNKKKGNTSTREKASMKSFKALVEYSEGARCRHAFMSEYFGDKKPECNSGCDFCRKPKGVEEMIEQLRGGVFVNKGHHGYAKTYMCSDFGQVNKNLYGGGRHGDDTRYSDDETVEASHEEKCKKYRNKLIQDEFRKRRHTRQKNSNEEDIENIPGLSCRIKNASNVTHIPKLAVKVREFCLERLQNSLIKNSEGNNRSTVCVERLAVNLEYDIFLASRSSQKYKLSIQQKVKEIDQSTEHNEIFSGGDSTSKSPVQDNHESEIESKFKRGEFVKASELLSNREESGVEGEIKRASQFVKASELLSIEKTAPEDMDIDSIDDDTEQPDKNDGEPGQAGANTTERSLVTISSSTIKPLQGSPNGNSPNESVLQTLKRPSISEDVQKIIAKRQKHPAKSEYDIPSLPPLPSLTDSYIKTTFTAENSDSVSSKVVKREPQSGSRIQSKRLSNISPGLLVKRDHSISSVKQESSRTHSQVTGSNIQPTSTSSTCSQNLPALTQTISLASSAQATYITTQSGQTCSDNSNINGVQSGPDVSSVFSLGTPSSSAVYATSFQGMFQQNTSNIPTNYSSGIPTNIHQGVYAGIPCPQGAQPIPGVSSLPVDPRLYHGANQSHTGSMPTPSSVYFQHNRSLPAFTNVNGTATSGMQHVQLPLFGFTQFNSHLKKTSKNETAKTHSRSAEKKVEKTKTNKKDCADIIVRYLTPYYRSGEVESKSSFKTLAKEMTERLVQTMGSVSNDKLRNTARSLVKVYFDEKRRKSSKTK